MSQQEDSLISALYPPPPPFVKFFTDENIEKLENSKKGNDTVELEDEDKVLEFLTPPTQPEGDTYRSFGNIWQFNDKMPKLEEMGIEKLYKDPDDKSSSNDSKFKIQELRTLLKSLLLNFLEVIGVMSSAPDQFHIKIDQIRTILINIHHLLNEYRPHQSRESLILLMEKQIDTKRNEIEEIENTCKNVEEKIKHLIQSHVDRTGEPDQVQDIETQTAADDMLELKIDKDFKNSSSPSYTVKFEGL
ncbi:hypothetical protein WICPIJ_001121 [Wickerhamomyces pijperi]|uniref:Mediator of RNA polymerase II transcription subunit 7 n=1 Tax=Wickerhamomyces pijperi TaxID=599730 RepID=A0A9P8TR37_WICPI|nr:hypothetical protein WICPIJ_001121 [Wickerhamomyces pijperi]